MPENHASSDVCALATNFALTGGDHTALLAPKVVKLLMAGVESAGFWSGEVIPPTESDSVEWKVIQRYRTRADAGTWQNSDKRKELLGEIKTTIGEGNVTVSEAVSQTIDTNYVTAVIVSEVRPEMEKEYLNWESRIQEAQAKFPGYRGAYLQPPAPDVKHKQWATMLRFSNPEDLEKWMDCQERKDLVKEGEKFSTSTEIRKVGAYPGWVPLDSAGNPPPDWKTAMLVLLGLFPVVMLEIKYCQGLVAGLLPTPKDIVNMAGSVAATSFVTMPIFIKTFAWWLWPPKGKEVQVGALGTLVVLALYGVLMAIFWRNP